MNTSIIMPKWYKIPAFIRWKCFDALSKLFLGKKYWTLFSYGQIHDLLVSIQTQAVGNHVKKIFCLHKAEIVDYAFPDSYPIWFPPRAAFNDKYAFYLTDVVVLPGHAAVFIPDAGLIEYSTIGADVFMTFGGMFDYMVKPQRIISNNEMVYPFSTCYAYYHELIEIMTGALQARKINKDIKFLVHSSRPKFIDGFFEFFGIKPSQIVCANVPVQIDNCMLVPHIPARSFASSSDLNLLRDEIATRLDTTAPQDRKIYISRRHAPSRSLDNEGELEDLLRDQGFETVFFEEMCVREQFQAIYNSKFIVATHGSGLANLAAARVNTKVLEIISPEWQRSTFARMSKSLSLDYDFVMAEEKDGHYFAPLDTILNGVRG